MFGRVRTASSSADSLEIHASKLLKQDSLSIYEATLLKLKLGSQHDHIKQAEASSLAFPQENDAAECSSVDPMALDSNSNSNDDSVVTFSSRASDCNTSAGLKQQRGGNMSVVHLFSRFKTSMIKSAQNEMMKMKQEGSSSTSTSSSSSEFLSQCPPPLGSMDLHLESEMECVS